MTQMHHAIRKRFPILCWLYPSFPGRMVHLIRMMNNGANADGGSIEDVL